MNISTSPVRRKITLNSGVVFFFGMILLCLYLMGYRLNIGVFTGEWLHYYNKDYDFEISYPPTWAIVVSGASGNHNLVYERVTVTSGILQLPPRLSVNIDQKMMKSPTPIEISEWAKALLDENDENVSLSEMPYEGKTYLTRVFMENKDVTCQEVYIPRTADGIVIRGCALSKTFIEVLPIFQRIVSSFGCKTACPPS